ncbi:MAG: DNA methyltransferase, partial [bacterium]
MKSKNQHTETAVLCRSPSFTNGNMYSMHKYWSKKSPDVAAAYIDKYTDPGDVILDPFCGSGIIACEAVRLGRRAIAIDINPMATFITRLTLMPINLSRLQWAFHDVQTSCEEKLSNLFATTCSRCRKDAVVEFVVREGNDPVQIAYKCTCSGARLFKDPDDRDVSFDTSFKRKRVPFWFPSDIPLPVIRRERFQYLHELFTKRNLIALSTILNEIEKINDVKIRELMKLAFTASLDKCSRLKPLSPTKEKSPRSLQQGWLAVRFHAPKMWKEVNPWLAFARSFKKVYAGKRQSNVELKDAVVSTSYEEFQRRNANAVILTGSADKVLAEQIKERCVHYVLTDPPFGAHIQYLTLSTFWGAWLKFDFDYDN